MAAINNDKVITEINQKEEENPVQEECSSQESDFEEEVYEDIVLDEASDTEDYKPPVATAHNEEEEEENDDDASSGDEEVGVHVQEVAIGKSKLLKLKFDDVEEKRKEFLHEMDDDDEEEESEEELDKENIEDNSQEKSESATANQETPKAKFDDYRNILDEDMADYNSDDDGHFNPVYCGETLSDVEYQDDDERNTESEPEVEEQGENFKHKRTGEPLICIRMMEDLELPPDCSLAAAAAEPNPDVQNAMECA